MSTFGWPPCIASSGSPTGAQYVTPLVNSLRMQKEPIIQVVLINLLAEKARCPGDQTHPGYHDRTKKHSKK